MSIAEKLTTISNNMQLVYDAGKAASTEAPSKDVNFYDYDGRVLYSYNSAEFAELTALPANPSHTGLTAQGWNWTLADAKTRVASYGQLSIGQMYATSDGKTRLYIHVGQLLKATVPLLFEQTVSEGVTIDWGDNSAAETVSGTGAVDTSHTYAAIGDYVISLNPATGCDLKLGRIGANDITYCVLGETNSDNATYRAMLMKVEIGSGTSLNSAAFRYCGALKTITLPENVSLSAGTIFQQCSSLRHITFPTGNTDIGIHNFYECRSLASISFPKTVYVISNNSMGYCGAMTRIDLMERPTSGDQGIGNSAFVSWSNLQSITIPETATKFGSSAFQSCKALTKLTIPANVAQIDNNALSSLSSLVELHVQRQTPPTIQAKALGSSSDGSALPATCTIYVPSGKLATYQAATNWSVYASQMQEEASS